MPQPDVPFLARDLTPAEKRAQEQAIRDSERFIRLARKVIPRQKWEGTVVAEGNEVVRYNAAGVEVSRRRKCASNTINGLPCKSFALNFSEHCIVHSTEEELERVGYDKKKREKKSRVLHAIDALVEQELEDIMGVYTDALKAVDPVSGRADHAVRMRAADTLLDRTQGKATSRTEVTGKDGDNFQLEHLMAQTPGEATDTA